MGYVQKKGDHFSVGTIVEAELVVDPEESGMDDGVFNSKELNKEAELVTDFSGCDRYLDCQF